ncbi:MAG: ABC transporter substrate-binding protein [Oscillospiraceae bacterium]|jgi:ABC-type nitrate/sulfonate/bicarbonate transport system substrate-binding protein|nr:ABC transporter substrate-binding protein [Oscillospiraceae bacterium]
MKKAFSILLALALLTALLVGCANTEQPSSGPTPPPGSAQTSPSGGQTPPSETPNFKKLTVGTMPLTVGVPVQYAYDNGFYADEGLDVEIIIFATGAPINEAYSAGQLDIAVSGLASVYSLANGNAKWVGEINSTGGMGIYVRPNSPILDVKGQVQGKPDIYGSADLVRGVKILGPLGTTAQFNAIGYAKCFGLSSADIEQVHMEYGPAYQAFQSGEGDAFAANPPFSFQAEEAGYVCAASFEDSTGVSLMDGIFCTLDMSDNRHEELVRFIRATYKACEALQDYDTRFAFSKEWFNANGKEYDDKTLASEIAVRDYIDKAYMSQPSYVYGKGMTEIASFFVDDGKIEPANFPNVQASYDKSIIKEALGIDFTVDQ